MRIDQQLGEYARLTAADNACDLVTAWRMMLDEIGEVASETGYSHDEIKEWLIGSLKAEGVTQL